MTIFVDASALVAIIRGEPDAFGLEARLNEHDSRLTSGLAMWEAARALGRFVDIHDAHDEIVRFCDRLAISVVPIDTAEAARAVTAHARFGKGTGHPAQLNMGDCFAYACARTNQASLLYKGDDFLQTDLGR